MILTKKLTRNSFLLSVILHLSLLLFFLLISTIITRNPIENNKKSPQLYIPSYVYKCALAASAQQPIRQNPTPSETVTQPQKAQPLIQQVENKSGRLPQQQKSVSVRKNDSFQQKSILAMSRNFIQHNQMDTAIDRLNNTEAPILLVGDKHAIVDPLVKLVGRALSAHFRYPEIEGRFGAQGLVYIELTLHPEGYFSDVQIVRPSDIQDFNAAALYAVNTAPTVVGIDKFLSRPKRFVVGFIFE